MSTTHAASRAEQILHQAEQDANAYADRVGGDFRTARSYSLPAIDSPDLTTYIEQFAVTDESRDAGAFARATGAAAALRGEL